MKKHVKFSLLSILFLVAGCKGATSSSTSSSEVVNTSSSSSEVSSSSTVISSSSSSSSVLPDYGELVIPNMKIFTNFPDTPLPSFTLSEYASDITYEIKNTSVVEYKDGYIEEFNISKDIRSITEIEEIRKNKTLIKK